MLFNLLACLDRRRPWEHQSFTDNCEPAAELSANDKISAKYAPLRTHQNGRSLPRARELNCYLHYCIDKWTRIAHDKHALCANITSYACSLVTITQLARP
jgi:hypothetical protein